MRDTEVVSFEAVAAMLARFGLDKEARLRWLLGFIERDLTTREAAAEATREVWMFAFAARMGGGVRPWVPVGMGRLDKEALDTRRAQAAPSTVKRAQRAVRDALNAFASHGRCSLPFKIVGWERLSDGRVIPLIGGDWWSRFYGAVCMLVVELGPDLRVCENPTCRKLFLRSKRQTYCSSRCSQRERTQRFREKHPQRVSDLRHASHVRSQQKRLGPHVKVRRRRRQAVSKDSQ